MEAAVATKPERKHKAAPSQVAPPCVQFARAQTGASAGMPLFAAKMSASKSHGAVVQCKSKSASATASTARDGALEQERELGETSVAAGSADRHALAAPAPQHIAREGLNGASRPLPEAEQIQSSFGRHDVSHVQVQVGGPAAQANQRLQSQAYTHGSRIAFRNEPDMRLAAHEAAHVVQQRRGVHLSGGIGAAGDPYERQADRAAEAVLNGESAEGILDQDPGPDSNTVGVQRKCECGGQGCAACQAEEQAPLQMQLQVNAARLHEPDVIPTAASRPDSGGGEAESASGTAEAGTAKGETEPHPGGEAAEGSALQAAEAGEPLDAGPSDAQAGPDAGVANAAGGSASATEEGGGGCSGGARAGCYNEDIEEPEEEPEEQPADPPATEAEENMESASPDAQEVDDCPIEQAVESQSQAAAPAGGDAAMQSGGGGPAEPSSAGQAAGSGTGGEAEGQQAAVPATRSVAASAQDDAGQLDSALAPIEAAIADTEAQRAEAVSAYGAAAAQLSTAGRNSRAVAGAVDFAANDAAGAGGQMKLGQARSVARGFFNVAVDRIDAAVAMALDDVPLRLGSLAGTIKSDIGGAMESHKASISSRIAAARAQAWFDAEAARQQVFAEHASTIAVLESETASAIETLSTEYAAALGQVDDLETDGLDQINALYADSRTAHEQVGVVVGQEATARGAQYVDAYESCKIYRKDSFFAGYLTDRRAKAQQNAAREVAKGYRENLEKAAGKQAREAMKGRKKDRCGLIAAARSARASLDGQFTAMVEALQSGLEQAQQSAGASRDHLLASIDDALTSTLTALDQQEHSQRQAVNDTGYLQQLAVEQAAHSAAASVQTSVLQAVLSLQAALTEVRDLFATTETPDPGALSRLLGQATARLESGVGGLMSQVELGVAGAQGRLQQTGSGAAASLTNISNSNDEQTANLSSGFSASMAALVDGARSSFAQQSSQYAEQTQSATTSGVAAFQQVVEGFVQTIATVTGNVAGALSDSEAKLDDGLRKSLSEMDCAIQKQAWTAASKEAPAWKTVVAILLIIVVIVVVALVIGPAVIGAVGAAASALGAGAAAGAIGTIVGGAIVGAAASATIQVINNWRTNTALTEGVGRAAIMGAIGGALGAGAGLAGQALGNSVKALSGPISQFALNVAADTVIELGTAVVTGEFSWETFGTAMLMSFATGGFGQIKGVQGIQARMQVRGARVVPGARAGAHAARLHPGSAREGAPTRVAEEGPSARPRAPDDAAAGPVPREQPRTESDVAAMARQAEADGHPPRAADGEPTRLESEPDTPARNRTDSELAEATTPMKVGDDDHSVVPRKIGGKTELWVCSRACGTIRGKLDDMIGSIQSKKNPSAAELKLRDDLVKLQERVGNAEQRIEGGEASKSIVTETGAIAREFQSLGQRHSSLGEGVSTPKTVAEPDTPGSVKSTGREPVEIREFANQLEARQVLSRDDFGKVKLKPNQEAVYVLRDSEGNILKVGKTSEANAEGRFGIYKSTGEELDLGLTLEVTPLKVPRKGTRTPLSGEDVETALRARLTEEGHIMPWDNSSGRLGRPGPGVPFERVVGGAYKEGGRTKRLPAEYEWTAEGNIVAIDPARPPKQPRPAPPTANDLTPLMKKHQGDIDAVRTDLELKLGIKVERNTLRGWLQKHGISITKFKQGKG